MCSSDLHHPNPGSPCCRQAPKCGVLHPHHPQLAEISPAPVPVTDLREIRRGPSRSGLHRINLRVKSAEGRSLHNVPVGISSPSTLQNHTPISVTGARYEPPPVGVKSAKRRCRSRCRLSGPATIRRRRYRWGPGTGSSGDPEMFTPLGRCGCSRPGCPTQPPMRVPAWWVVCTQGNEASPFTTLVSRCCL